MKNLENLFTPIMQSDSIQSLDIMRGIVLFEFLLMNINGIPTPGSKYFYTSKKIKNGCI
jgi:uncharacterized membrane protein YeiB